MPKTGGRRIREHTQRVSYGRSSRENLQRDFFSFPKSFIDVKVEEFYRLEQGDFSVPEYEKKFSELIRLVPFFAENEQKKINRFMAGLNPQ